MPKENEKQRIFTRRAVIFGGMQAAAFSALAGRLYYLQFIKEKEYTTLSENNRIKLQLVAPERGLLLDRYGLPMAANEKNYQLYLDYSLLTQPVFHATVEKLYSLVPFGEKKYRSLLASHVSSASMPELLKEHLTWEEVSLIELHMLELVGAQVITGQIRHYPLGETAAHVIGYVGAASPDDLGDDAMPGDIESLMRLPDFKTGKNGVEKMLEERLRGTAGIRQLEVNVHGVPVREVGKKESVPGENVRLTLDSRLQAFAAEKVRGQSASVVVMDVDTGNVLTLASMPGFDPDIFSTGIETDYWKQLSSDPKSPLLNKAITGQYPPGSTFKMMTGLAGLEAEAITASSTVFCPGWFQLGDHRFSCWKEGGHGTVNFHEAIKQSCDTFFYTVGERLGAQPYADMARQFGLGATHNIGLISEKAGIIPDPAWKMQRYNERWSGGDTINCAIGQGYVLATPLQLAIMVARIASGKAIEPRLVVPAGEETPSFAALEVDEEMLAQTREAMAGVVNEPRGTAYGHRIAEPRFAMAGKTGTAQVRHLIREGMDQSKLPWEDRHHAFFVAYAPVENPKYACCVAIEHGGGGASAAAPVAKDVLLKVQQLAEEDKKV